jgi:endonuclease/exonuclease/phosphatase family metal-dependent hydrolase
MSLKTYPKRAGTGSGNRWASSEPSPALFSVVSYNIHRFVGTDRRFDPERVGRVIRECGSEIVGLQEIDSRFYRNENQIECLSSTTGLEMVHGPTRRNENGHYGNALLTSLPVTDVRRIELTVRGREPRGALDVDLLLKGMKVRVIVAHLGLSFVERRLQVKRLLDIFCAERDRMEIMLGDFNEWIPVGRPLCWVNSFFGRSPSPRTFPSFMPILPLDRIWIRPRDALIEMSAHRTPLSRVASDHLPVKAMVVPGGKPEIGCAC